MTIDNNEEIKTIKQIVRENDILKMNEALELFKAKSDKISEIYKISYNDNSNKT